MRSRQPIPSFGYLKGPPTRPATVKLTPPSQVITVSASECNTETEARNPAKELAFKTLSLEDMAGPSRASLTVGDGGDEENIILKAHKSHIPIIDRPSSPTGRSGLQAILLTNHPQPGTPGEPNVSGRASPWSRPRNVPDAEGLHPSLNNSEDWCLKLPRVSSIVVSLPPSAHDRTTSSRSPSKHWVLDSGKDLPHSPDFPPTDFTDVVLIPKDRNVKFHVDVSTIFNASPLLGDLIRPYLSVPLQAGEVEPEVYVYTVGESYEVLDAILRFIHPQVTKPTVRSITHLARLLAACKRYEVEAGIHTLSVVLIEFAGLGASPTNTNILVGSPIQCYGLACKLGLSNVAKLISTNCLAVDPLKADLGVSLVGVASKDVRRLFDLHHSRGLAALRLVDAAIDAPEFWCNGCSGLASWYDIWRQAAEHELQSKPISRTVFSPSFLAGCLKQAINNFSHHCMDHYLAPKTQLRFAILQRDIDGLKDRI